MIRFVIILRIVGADHEGTKRDHTLKLFEIEITSLTNFVTMQSGASLCSRQTEAALLACYSSSFALITFNDF